MWYFEYLNILIIVKIVNYVLMSRPCLNKIIIIIILLKKVLENAGVSD